jgi:peptidoglycan DL-endopeptidase CwlO
MQTLSVLADQNNQRLTDLRTAEQTSGEQLAALAKAQRQQAAELRRLAAEKDKVERLVDQTNSLLTQLRDPAAARQRANAADSVDADPGLPAGSAPAPSGSVAAVVRYAQAQVGKPYVWGADGPDFFDCSGLTMMAWRQAGSACRTRRPPSTTSAGTSPAPSCNRAT